MNTIDRIMANSKVSDGDCIEWQRYRTPKGYGTTAVNGKRWRVHRLAYSLLVGEIPDGMLVCHKCDNPQCFNPDHLFLGTHADNVADKISKGRQSISGQNQNFKLGKDAVLDIRRRHRDGEKNVSIAREYGIDPSNVGHIASRRTWKHVK